MTATGVAFQSQSRLVVRPELPGCSPEVESNNYSVVSVEALDAEIVASVDAAHGHYNGLRRELVLRLLPALAEMRSRHGSQGARNDVNHRLGLPKRAGWEDYLLSRGLKPDTVRGWFQKHAAVRTLGLLVGGSVPRKVSTRLAVPASNQPRLYQVASAGRVLIVAATSAKHAIATTHKGMVGLGDDADLEVEEIGTVIEIPDGYAWLTPIPQVPKERAASDRAIFKALAGSPGASPAAIALRLGVSVVDVRRVETQHRGRLSR
jgi:hypothetical protein